MDKHNAFTAEQRRNVVLLEIGIGPALVLATSTLALPGQELEIT